MFEWITCLDAFFSTGEMKEGGTVPMAVLQRV
jgi:hypothetical protein